MPLIGLGLAILLFGALLLMWGMDQKSNSGGLDGKVERVVVPRTMTFYAKER